MVFIYLVVQFRSNVPASPPCIAAFSKSSETKFLNKKAGPLLPLTLELSYLYGLIALGLFHRHRIEGYSISNINQQLNICHQMLNLMHQSLFSVFCKKFVAFIVYSLSFNLADLYWPERQFTSIRYLWSLPNIFAIVS